MCPGIQCIRHTLCVTLMCLGTELWAITAPRPGTNSSSEPIASGKGSSRINSKGSTACLGGWEEGGTPRGNARKHGESIQTAFRKRLQAQNLGPPCSEKYKELEKSVRVEEIDGVKLVKNLAVKMEEMFRKKAEATRRLVEAAEEAHHQHEDNPDLETGLDHFFVGQGRSGCKVREG
ncbi:unnamed protein product [Pleuronectes platessa]|uniref:Uncharacterized protein n=1 Tax=Pleuronectes platessa TaxID=8262 RepID=A0A9N7UJW3_PLEPL|nr:unnamed protein product [Pleuronectes platessa]